MNRRERAESVVEWVDTLDQIRPENEESVERIKELRRKDADLAEVEQAIKDEFDGKNREALLDAFEEVREAFGI
jgi:hypothetical protein